MSKCEDLTGKRFGRLLVVERAENDKHGSARWLCKCDCGNTTIVYAGCLRNGSTTSCKCLQRELSSKRLKTHGQSRTRLHNIWLKMIERCHNENHVQYHRYGGRGIKICEQWENDFIAFRDWSIANGYDDSLTIDRIDNDGDYCPENCRWVTMAEQNKNRSTNHMVTMRGKTQSVTEWCKELGLNRCNVYKRLQRMSPEEAFYLK